MKDNIKLQLSEFLTYVRKTSEKEEIIEIVILFLNETNKKKLEETWVKLKLLSESDGACQFDAKWLLGFCYEEGFFVSKNIKLAFDYLSFSETENYAPAQYNLGALLLMNRFSEPSSYNPKKGFKLIKKAANQNYIPAQMFLGLCYENGHGTKRNIKKAIQVYKPLVEQNNHSATYVLGRLYWEKYDNLAEAIPLLEKATEMGCEEAPSLLAFLCLKLPTPDVKKAIKYYNLALTQGQSDALYEYLSEIYYNEKYGVRDINKALDYSKKALVYYIRSTIERQESRKGSNDNLIDTKTNKESEEILKSDDIQKILDLYESLNLNDLNSRNLFKRIQSLKQLWTPSQTELFFLGYDFSAEYTPLAHQLKHIFREYELEISEDLNKDEKREKQSKN